MLDMFENAWQNQDEISVDHCVDITLPVSKGLSPFRFFFLFSFVYPIHIQLLADRTVRDRRSRCPYSISNSVSFAYHNNLPPLPFLLTSGFGRRISWKDDLDITPLAGHQMTFKESLHVVSRGVYTKLIVPSWAMGFTASLRKVRLAFEELEVGLFCFVFLPMVSILMAVILAVHARDDTCPTVF